MHLYGYYMHCVRMFQRFVFTSRTFILIHYHLTDHFHREIFLYCGHYFNQTLLSIWFIRRTSENCATPTRAIFHSRKLCLFIREFIVMRLHKSLWIPLNLKNIYHCHFQGSGISVTAVIDHCSIATIAFPLQISDWMRFYSNQIHNLNLSISISYCHQSENNKLRLKIVGKLPR